MANERMRILASLMKEVWHRATLSRYIPIDGRLTTANENESIPSGAWPVSLLSKEIIVIDFSYFETLKAIRFFFFFFLLLNPKPLLRRMSSKIYILGSSLLLEIQF